MTTDNYTFNLNKSRVRFDSYMGPLFREMELQDKSFRFRITGKVFFSYITRNRLEEIEIDEENKSKDSIAHSGEIDIRKFLPWQSFYGISVENASISDLELYDDIDKEEYKYKYLIERYMYECSIGDKKVFCASTYKDDSDYLFDNTSPVSVILGGRTIDSHKLLEEISYGTMVELEIAYGAEDDPGHLFCLRSVTIIDQDYILNEKADCNDYKARINDNNSTISALLIDNDRMINELGMHLGIYERRSAFKIEDDSRIVIPENSIPRTLQGNEDNAIIESFFSNPGSEEDRKIFESSLEIVKSSLRMIDLYKFVLSYMKLPEDIKFQTARTCYVAWMEILESITKAVFIKSKTICQSISKSRCCLSECRCCGMTIEMNKCRYNIARGYVKNSSLRNLIERLERPDVVKKIKGENVIYEKIEDNTACPDKIDHDILGISSNVYRELKISYGVRNTFVHKITSKVSVEEQAEINNLEKDPNKTLDTLEQNCKIFFKALSKVVASANNQGKCLREYIEYSKGENEICSDYNVPEITMDTSLFTKIRVDASCEMAVVRFVSEMTSSQDCIDYRTLISNIDVASQKEIYVDKDRILYLLANSSVWLLKLKFDNAYRNKLLVGIDNLKSDMIQFDKYLNHLKEKLGSNERMQISLYRHQKNPEKNALLRAETQKTLDELLLYVQQHKSIYDDLLKNNITENKNDDWTAETTEYNTDDIRAIISNYVYLSVFFSVSSDLFESTKDAINAFCETNFVPQIIKCKRLNFDRID